MNFFQPSFKLAGKTRDEAKVKKTYYPPGTPYQRLLADTRTSEAVRRRVTTTYRTLDPVRLFRTIRTGRRTSYALPIVRALALQQRLHPRWISSWWLRTAWQGGEVRPTNQPKPKAPRGRRRPGPAGDGHAAAACVV